MDDTRKAADTERSDEEIAWDQEFAGEGTPDYASTLSDLIALVVKIPLAIVQMPINMLPTDTRQHTRAAVREGFLAARTLISALGDGIESILADPSDSATPVSGPPGTWGTARHGSQPQRPGTGGGTGGSSSAEATPSKVKRIELDAEGVVEAPPGEGRGLRADIDY